MLVDIKELENLISSSLLKYYGKKSSKLITELIMFGELSGKKSHGIVRLLIGGSSVLAQKPTGKPKIISKTKLSKIINGNKNPAMLVGQIAMVEAIKLAKKNGFGIVGTNNTFSTSGCLSYYLECIAKQDLIGIIMARSPSDIAPFNSKEPLFGTNPIGFAIPSKRQPLIFDMGTSAISWGELIKADSSGETIPKDIALDSKGDYTTTPSEAMKGAILTFDKSYKSSGLSMMVEILSGVLTGASFLDLNEDNQWGNTFLLFQPDLLITRDGKQIRITGENSLYNRDKCIKSKKVEVSDDLLSKLNKIVNSK
jgi:ureidoglycolate dehydrogenase (NAD+)